MPPKQPPKGADDPEDPLRKAADWLRARTGPEARGAVLGDARVDVFRSKDFYRCLRAAAPPFLDALVPPPEGQPNAEKRLEAQIGALGTKLLAASYISRVDRVVKVRSKGRKHVKFPRSVEPHPQAAFVPDGFYAWNYDAPRSLWTTVASALLVVLVFAATLFPVAPYKVKLGVLYSAMGLLIVLFSVSVLRVILFTVLWVLTGRSVWLLPNLYSDDVPIGQILKPLIAEDAPAKGAAPGEGPSLARRLTVAAGAAAFVYSLYRATPEGHGVVNNIKSANKGILEMLNLHEGPKSIAGSGGDAVQTAAEGGAAKPPPTAATAAAAALQRGMAGPAGVRARELDPERLVNLAPIPEPDEDEEGGAGAGEGQAAAQAAKAAQEQAQAAEPAAETAAEPEAAAPASEAASSDEDGQAAAETAAEL